ncbi:type II secretion system F family protein [Aquipseudomonas ullengensis]|uniref:Type II secretion system F family protein n=1 Tax=Aquipseudomonas ullengensis TaxID=2759166 RepID=A0A7W4LHW9_9GAMM|nr:type II secretion system F family protein [Pseudomonas ullengensis]MBB2493431.1 type II secretion system F family protein [Pseudomonas ullengensis]
MSSSSSAVLDLNERAVLFAQLAAMEQAGLPLDRALATLQLRPATQARIEATTRQLAQGRDLASAGQKAGLFSPLEVTLLQAAQSAGSPARLYRRLADTYGHQAAQAKALKSRLLMPAGVLLLALLIQPLPALVGGSLSLFGYLWGVVQPLLMLGALLFLGRSLLQHLQRPASAVRASSVDSALLSLPLFGPMLARRNLRDYFESLGLMLEAGLPMFDALPKAAATLRNSQLRRDFLGLQQRVQAGAPLAQALVPLTFPGQAQLLGLVRTGEASGSLPATLLSYASRESAALASFQEQLATWLPRLVYAALVLWMAYGLLTGAGVGPQLPADL